MEPITEAEVLAFCAKAKAEFPDSEVYVRVSVNNVNGYLAKSYTVCSLSLKLASADGGTAEEPGR